MIMIALVLLGKILARQQRRREARLMTLLEIADRARADQTICRGP